MSNVIPFRARLSEVQAREYDSARGDAFVAKLAAPLARAFAGLVQEGDLIGLGDEALLHVARRYDPARGPFRPYARCRVRGAMLDGIRTEAFQKRVTRAGMRASDEALAFYQDDFDSLHHGADDRQRRLDTFSDMVVVATLLGETEEAQKACAPDEVAEQEELALAVAVVRAGVQELRPKQQRILELLFKTEPPEEEGKTRYTQEDVAAIMGVDVSTVQRNLKVALERLRKLLSLHGIDALPDPSLLRDALDEKKTR